MRGENICGCIARNIGRTPEMDAFELVRNREEATIGRQTMLEWYAPYGQAALLGHLKELRLAPGVREAFARLKSQNIKIALVSITWQFAVEWLAADLGADYAVGTGWSGDDEIEHFWPEDKAIWLENLLLDLQIERHELVAVGDSHGDIPMLRFAHRGYFVGDILPDALSHVPHWPDGDILAIVEDALSPVAQTA